MLCAFASLLRYVRNSAMVAVAGGKGLCGRMGTSSCMTGLFVVSRKGVLVRTSTNASSAARSP